MVLEKFKIYTDALLTQPLAGNLIYVHNSDGSTGNVDKVLYIGSVDAGFSLKTTANPDIDAIVLTLADNDVNANTPKVLDIKLSLNQAGLDAATAGAALNIGTSIAGGAANAIAVYIRSSEPDGVGVDLTVSTNEVTES